MMMIFIIIIVMVIVLMSIDVLLTFISVITMIVIASPSIYQYHSSIIMIMMILNVCHIDVLTLYQYYYGSDFFFDEYPLHFSGRAAETLETYGGFLKWGIPQKP